LINAFAIILLMLCCVKFSQLGNCMVICDKSVKRPQ